MTLIPNGIFEIYENAVDELLTNSYTSGEHTIYYPAIKVSCDNCTVGAFGGTHKNRYKSGGVAPFSFGSCPLCGGNGFKEEESTDTLRTRVYWQKKDWIKQGNINIENSDVMIIGSSSDLPKILRMNWRPLVVTEPKK